MGWGASAQVLEPPNLREAIRPEVEAVLAGHAAGVVGEPVGEYRQPEKEFRGIPAGVLP